MISYEPLRIYLAKHPDIVMSRVAKDIGMSSATLAKINKGEAVHLSCIESICLHFGLKIQDVVEVLPDPVEGEGYKIKISS